MSRKAQCFSKKTRFKWKFMLRSEVLQLYRNILKTVKKIPDDHYRQEMKDWARRDFKSFKNLEDEEAIKMMITKGKLSLRELEQIIGHAQCHKLLMCVEKIFSEAPTGTTFHH